MSPAEKAQRFLARFGGARSAAEQAQIFFAQGQTCQAAAIYRNIVATEPTAENLSMLAALYMEQGLHEDAQALYLRVVQMEAKKP
jgi:alkyl sulfatase BDS1-like metallo-beta-lactamase superfamily hydrolase